MSTDEEKCIPRNFTAEPLPALWDWQGWYVLINLAIMFLILWKDWIRTEFTILLCVMMIYSAQIITTEEALIGFSNSGVMTVTVLYVVAEGLSATGGVDYFMSKVMGNPRTLGVALMRMMIPVAVASAFINNTPLVAVMIPIIQKWSRKVNIPPSQLMIPLSFATILGGTITMIGTSTNLVVAGRASIYYCRNIGIFELSLAGVPNAILGLAYILLLAPVLLPNAKEYERRRQLAKLAPGQVHAQAKKSRKSNSIWNRIYRCILPRSSSGMGAEEETLVEVEELVGMDNTYRRTQRRDAQQQQQQPTMQTDGTSLALVDPAAASSADGDVEAASVDGSISVNSAAARQDSKLLSKDASDFILHGVVLNGSPVNGKSVSEAGLRGEDGLYLISVQRGNTLYSAVGRNFEVENGDLLSFTGLAENFVAFCSRKGLQPMAVDSQDGVGTASSVPESMPTSTVQAIVRDGSDLIGKTPKEADFRKKYNAAILSIHRAGHRLKLQKLGQAQLKVGDVLLLVTNDQFDWNSPLTQRDLKPRRDPEQLRMIQLQDRERIDFDDQTMAGSEATGSDDDRGASAAQSSLDRQFYIAMKVAETSKLGSGVGSVVGRTIEGAGLRSVPGVVLFAVQRVNSETGQKDTIRAPGPDLVLQVGDVLWFFGERDGVTTLRRFPGLADVDSKQLEKLQIAAHHRRLVEVVLSLRSDMLYKSVREARFRSRFSAAIVAVHRQGAPILSTIGDVILQPGDVLILDAGPTFVPQFRDDPNFLLIAELDGSAPPRFDKFYIAFFTSVLMVALAAGLDTYGVSLVLLALWASAIMLATECLTGERAMKSINWGVIITVACAFGLSTALEKTKVAPIFGNAFVQLSIITGTGEIGVLTTVMIATALLSSLIANNAAALVMLPIAAQAAAGLGVNPDKMLFALMFGASDCFTPFGYQTNLMVYGPVIILYLLDQWWIMWIVSVVFLIVCFIFDLVVRGGKRFSLTGVSNRFKKKNNRNNKEPAGSNSGKNDDLPC